MSEITLDFAKICRTCKCEFPVMLSLYQNDDNPRIDEMLMACTSLKINLNDGLPALICCKCVDMLKDFYQFKRQCEENESSLKQYAKGLVNINGSVGIKQELQNTAAESSFIEKILLENGDKQTETAIDSKNNQSDFIDFLDNSEILLTCRECGKKFTTVENLRLHKKRLHSINLYKCKLCNKSYTRQTHLQRHLLTHHKENNSKYKLHICKICNKTLTTRMEHLKRHLVTHLKDKPFECKQCKRGFNRSDHLDLHLKRCKGLLQHICKICNRGFLRLDSLVVHQKLHEDKQQIEQLKLPTLDDLNDISQYYYQIDYDPANNDNDYFNDDSDSEEDYFNNSTSDLDDNCLEPQIEVTENMDENSIRQVADLQRYNDNASNCNNRVYMPNEDDSDSTHSEYLPKKCVKVKRGRGRPRKRSMQNARVRPPKIETNDDEDDDDDDEEFNGEFPCPDCKEIFPKIKLLDEHARQQHIGLKLLHKCKQCTKQFTRYSLLKRHSQTHLIIKPFECTICHKCFNRRDHLNQHFKLHNRKMEHECDLCNRMFSRMDILQKHKATKHNIGERVMSEKKYECSICLKSFTTEKYRDIHVKGHLGEKKFKCRICDKCFLSKSHLTEHMKFHSDNSKKFLCSECGQRFIRNDYLVIHMRRHRGEKPFKCKYCGKGFPRTTDLTVHERYHTGEKTHLCTICGRGFGRAYNLTVHMRTHTGEKPYQCTYCEAAFAQGNDLKAHVRRHTGERFQCELCTESFLMGYLLTQHKRTVHGLNVVSNIRRLQPITKIKEDLDEANPPITIQLPKPIVPDIVLNNMQTHMHHNVTSQSVVDLKILGP